MDSPLKKRIKAVAVIMTCGCPVCEKIKKDAIEKGIESWVDNLNILIGRKINMAGRRLKNDDTRPPQNPDVHQLWYDQMLGKVRRWDGKEWIDHNPGECAGQTGSD